VAIYLGAVASSVRFVLQSLFRAEAMHLPVCPPVTRAGQRSARLRSGDPRM